jgi:hypothetical protein
MFGHDGQALEAMGNGIRQGFLFTVCVRRDRLALCGRRMLTEHLQFVRLQLRRLSFAHFSGRNAFNLFCPL